MERFGENAVAALGDATLRGALRHATDLFGERRRAAVADVGAVEFDALRDRARAIKDHTLERLDHYLEQFAERATARGVRVHWARDAEECCAIVAALCEGALQGRPEASRTIVKSKSMTSEEVRLGEHLERAGFTSVETDLGEWIVQLAGEAPSHIIVPAIHKTKAQIAELFAERVGTAPDADEQALTAAARRVLRERFAEAGIGISGVNFAIAETGSFLVLENEGNARLSITAPRVHIALMGIEKVVPRLADLDVFLKLLPRSGTGQHLTTYQTLITGPKSDPAMEGPDEVHVVVLDNGRSRMLEQAVTRQSLACIRCGACLNACPVYQQVGGHAYGSVYPGPIGAVITPQLAGLERGAQLPFASSLCGACRDVCPVRIDIPGLLLHLRGEVVGAASAPRGPRGTVPRRRGERLAFWLWSFVVRSPWRYAVATRLVRLGQRLFARGGRIGRVGGLLGWLAPPLAAWTEGRDLRPLARHAFRDCWRAGMALCGTRTARTEEGEP
ncbi:MAG: iron-sulfur cluster-binding protein [Planctomycetes bacterium]|nr:iron-sulfur cluster-binding protein [Planctomycetota bacterium]